MTINSAQSLVKESIDLISLPDVYIQLRNVMTSPDSSMEDIANVIIYDPAITARILKFINSPYYGLVGHVDTMTHAISLLGVQQVHDLVLATVVVDSFSGFTNDYLNIYDFWFNGVYCAVTARLLAYQCQDVDAERPFIAGLLHNIGHLVAYQKIPEACRAAVDMAIEKDIDLYIAEREVLGFDYGQVGAELMREWAFPESLQETTEFHMEPEKAKQYKTETAIIHIASAITQHALAKEPIDPEIINVNPVCWKLTGLLVEDMPEVKKEVDLQASHVMNMLFTFKKSA